MESVELIDGSTCVQTDEQFSHVRISQIDVDTAVDRAGIFRSKEQLQRLDAMLTIDDPINSVPRIDRRYAELFALQAKMYQ